MAGFTVAVLVKNEPGVLNRVTSMFRRRRFNINSLTVSETESSLYSRITVKSSGEDAEKRQLIDQLYKLPDVRFIKELTEDRSVNRELLLIKVINSPSVCESLKKEADEFEANRVDVTDESVIFQLAGTTPQIDSFIERMKDFGILEICRTGIVSLERGSDTIRKEE